VYSTCCLLTEPFFLYENVCVCVLLLCTDVSTFLCMAVCAVCVLLLGIIIFQVYILFKNKCCSNIDWSLVL
jgi:hypothetical protein